MDLVVRESCKLLKGLELPTFLVSAVIESVGDHSCRHEWDDSTVSFVRDRVSIELREETIESSETNPFLLENHSRQLMSVFKRAL